MITWRTCGEEPLLKRRAISLKAVYVLNALCATIAVVYFYSWGFTAKALLDGYYEIQAHSLAHGRLAVVPGPLLAYYHDSSLYMGNCYFYWGYLPAVLYLLIESILGRTLSHYFVVTAFVFCFLFFYQRIIGVIVDEALEARTRTASLWQYSTCVLLWGFVFNLPFPREVPQWFFGTFYIYEQSILFGLAFAFAASFVMIRGWERRDPVHLCASTVILALAAWTRPSWLALAGVSIPVALGLAWKISPEGLTSPAFKRGMIWLAASVTLLAGLFALNYAKFDSIWDFGLGCKMNSASDIALRRGSGFFSPQARFWVFVFNICSYLVSPEMVRVLGLEAKSFSCDAFFLPEANPSFFHFNPQFIPVLMILPLAVYRLISGKRSLLPVAVIVAVVGVTVMLVDTLAVPWVAMRYFVEAYYFIVPLFLVALVAILPARAAIVAVLILLAVHVPTNIQRFATSNPNLRLASADRTSRVSVDLSCSRDASLDLYIVGPPVWMGARLSRDEWSRLTPYNAMGIYEGPGRTLLASDVAAVYFAPWEPSTPHPRKRTLEVKGLRPLEGRGELRLFVEGQAVGTIDLLPHQEQDVSVPVTAALREKGPFQMMMVFIPAGRRYLPVHVGASPPLLFREISFNSP